MSIYETLSTRGIVLPPVTPPVAAFALAVQIGNLIFTSGHIASETASRWLASLERSLRHSQGQAAAHEIAIDLISTLHAETSDLNCVKRIVKLMVLVNSASAF